MRLEMKISLGSKSSPLGAAYAKRSPIYQIAALSGMALLLVVVATLQYKSATQLSAATEVRLGNNLQLFMTGWHRDLYDECSAGCIAMQAGPDLEKQPTGSRVCQGIAHISNSCFVWHGAAVGGRCNPAIQVGHTAECCYRGPPGEQSAVIDDGMAS